MPIAYRDSTLEHLVRGAIDEGVPEAMTDHTSRAEDTCSRGPEDGNVSLCYGGTQ